MFVCLFVVAVVGVVGAVVVITAAVVEVKLLLLQTIKREIMNKSSIKNDQ